MTRTAVHRTRAIALSGCRLRVTTPAQNSAQDTDIERAGRMARFATGARKVFLRAAAMGALVVAGWLLTVLFGMLGAAPTAATTHADSAAAAADSSESAATAAQGAEESTASPLISVSNDAEAMAGRTVDGLNSQRDPGLPARSTAGEILHTDGLVPTGGNSGPFGPVSGDVARSVYDPRLQAGRAPLARLLPPVVRTAADDPSFSPD
ncbi:hypothetical protein SAMN05421874_13015 [Nonomuraea maritima]|uniref:Uncharacterized protein n=1 Tax=Nonomuraea maritima TaxID=683260 RepID=A0A1G9N930_9ACTN|nr:hypothetical protein SAMN05421874_13015 [Nonomuraea maritima]